MSLRQRLGFSGEPVFLMDGSAYIFRGFYANQNMSRADGTPSNVLFMVLRMLLKILREESPVYFNFVLDGKGRNFRHRLYADYKAHRLVTPEPLAAQIGPLCQAVRDLGLHLTVSEDCEADDCIASLAARFSKTNPVVIIGADKDLKQCLAPGVCIWDPSGKDEKLTTLDGFTGEWGFEPRYWPDYQAIVGDSSDNIPGVPGIGAKGAATLLREFKGLEDIFERLAAVPPPLRKKLEGNEDKALLSRRLTTLRLDVCEPVALDDLKPAPPRQREILDFMQTWELRSLARELASMLRIKSAVQAAGDAAGEELSLSGAFGRLPGAPASAASGNPAEPTSAPGADGAPPAAGLASDAAPDSVSAYAMGGQNSLLDFAASAGPDGAGGPALAGAGRLAKAADLPPGPDLALIFARDLSGDKNDGRLLLGDGLNEALFNPADFPAAQIEALAAGLAGKRLAAPEFKALCEAFPFLRRIPLERCVDLSLSAWLLEPEEYDYGFKKLQRAWGAEAAAWLAQSGAYGLKDGETPKASALALGMRAVMEAALAANHLLPLLRDLEMPLIPVLLGMQDLGLGIDKAAFADFLAQTEKQLEALTVQIYAAAGREFNIRSAQQLGKLLFEDLGLPKARKTSGGQASTSQEALESLAGKHEIVDRILEFRKLEKLRSTYLEPLPRLADANNRLHTSFNQSSTATGRLSSSNPNLQNIPVRGPLGSRLRACFTAAPGRTLVSADYSQIELRVLAHLSQDPTLLDAFGKNEDIHRRTAALLYDVPQAEVTADQRRGAKTINFGLVYGMGPQKLARELGIGMNEAKAFIERYFSKLGKLREYFDQVEKDAREHGFVSTMAGRRRSCPEILSANQQLRSRARRQAINACIQGSAADIIKLAMLAAAGDETLRRLDARLILQIHDELLLECPPENAPAAGARLAAIMSAVKPGGRELSVPLSSDWGSGRSWAEAH